MESVLEPKYGQVQLSSFSVDTPKRKKAKKVTVSLDGQNVPAKWEQKDANVLISLQNRTTVKNGERFVMEIDV
jgi:hypothetical protein